MIFYSKTHKGNIRKVNEDCVYMPPNGNGYFAIVADGMGGHKAGDVASQITVETIVTELNKIKPQKVTSHVIKHILSDANEKVWKDAQQNDDRRGMGSTVTVAVFQNDKVLIGHIGDSRAYVLRGGKLTQITKDHSYVQMLVDKGLITKEEAEKHPQKNIITRAIGTEPTVKADVYTTKLEKGDFVLLCSDGLYADVSDENIVKTIEKDVYSAADQLIETALQSGGSDNISVIIAKTGGEAS